MYLLDTNIVGYWMRGDKSIINEIKNHKPSELSICNVKEFKRIEKLDVEDWAKTG